MTATGSSAYKSWVTTLRAWSRDTSISLDSLPPLNQDSFSPTTYARLLDHMGTAVGTMMRGWHDSFIRDWSAALGAGDLHGAEAALVEARRRLLPRLRLVSHPALSEEIRTTLTDSMRDDIASIQRQLEESVQDVSRFTTPTIRHQQEQMVRLVRANSLLHIFDGGYVDGSAIVRLADQAGAPGPAVGNPAGAPGFAVGAVGGAPGPASGAPVSVNRAVGVPGAAPGPVVGNPTGTPGPPAGAAVGEPVNEAARAPGPAAPTGQTGRPRRTGLFGRRFR